MIGRVRVEALCAFASLATGHLQFPGQFCSFNDRESARGLGARISREPGLMIMRCPPCSLNSARSARFCPASRRASVLAAVLLVAGALGGCSTADDPVDRDEPSSLRAQNGGQSIAEARTQLGSIDGLSATSIEVDETVSGLNTHHQVLVEATADSSADLPAFIDDLAQLGWSVNQDEPDTGVYVRLQVSPQPVIGEIAKQNSWKDAAYSTSTDRLKQLVLLPETAVRDRFGAWPGPVLSARDFSS